MGKITRQELGDALRAELDSVKNYIAGSLNEEMGAHMNSNSNPHNVTKAQVGLGDIRNDLQSNFESHIAQRNPHNARAVDVGALSENTFVGTGYGIMGGGTLRHGINLTLDTNYTDELYLRTSGINRTQTPSVRPMVFERTSSLHPGTAEIHRGYGGIGFSIGGGNPEIHVSPDGSVGINSYSATRNYRLLVDGSIRANNGIVLGLGSPGSNIRNTGDSPVGTLYRRSSDDSLRYRHGSGFATVYTSKKIRYGTSNPSGGSSGDIYIQY